MKNSVTFSVTLVTAVTFTQKKCSFFILSIMERQLPELPNSETPSSRPCPVQPYSSHHCYCPIAVLPLSPSSEKWTILTQVGHDGSRNRKRDWAQHGHGVVNDDVDDVELHVLGCRLTYKGQTVIGTNCDQCLSMVQCRFTSTETVRLIRTENPGRSPRLSHSS